MCYNSGKMLVAVAAAVQQHYARTSKRARVCNGLCPLLGEVAMLLELVTSAAALHLLYSCSYCIAAIIIV